MKIKLLPLVATVMAAGSIRATADTTQSYPKTVGLEIPDGDDNGLISQIDVSDTGIITSIQLTLATSSGWNGDLYAYLEHDDVISVLVNRPGSTSDDPEGAGSSGMNVTFSDAAAEDAHTGISSTFGVPATGTFQPDGREEDPDLVTDSSPRTLSFSGFTGQLAAGTWTLFIADLSTGDIATLENLTLSLTTSPAAAPAYDGWAADKGLDDRDAAHSSAKSADPDGDGHSNLYEFAFDGNPLSAAVDGKIVSKLATVGADQVLTFTLPVRTGAVFSGTPALVSAALDGIDYRIEGSLDLASFAQTISEVSGNEATAIQSGLPALGDGWTYRSFRVEGTVGTVPQAFIRAVVREAAQETNTQP